LDTYLDEHVLSYLDCRLVPPDNRYPDCRCALILTELRLYVSEDNFDGTYTDHFAIPILDVLRVERWAQVFSSIGEESVTVEPRGWRRILYRLNGPIAIARRDPRSVRSAREYVRVLYRAEDGCETALYFSDAGDPRLLSRELEKFKERWALNL
jgi:hypothetical protein